MPEGKALRLIPKLDGRSWTAGDVIPPAVIAKIKPEALRQLVVRGDIAVDGVDGSNASPGQMAHLMARQDKQGDQIKRLEGQVADLLAAKAPEPAKKATRRAQRQAETSQE